jgi:hypothetical protein
MPVMGCTGSPTPETAGQNFQQWLIHIAPFSS